MINGLLSTRTPIRTPIFYSISSRQRTSRTRRSPSWWPYSVTPTWPGLGMWFNNASLIPRNKLPVKFDTKSKFQGAKKKAPVNISFLSVDSPVGDKARVKKTKDNGMNAETCLSHFGSYFGVPKTRKKMITEKRSTA